MRGEYTGDLRAASAQRPAIGSPVVPQRVADTLEPRWLGRFVATAAAIVVVLSIGTPLLGLRVFSGADVILSFAPWREHRESDWEIRRLPVGDTVDSFLPKQTEFGSRFWEGDFALWNPWAAGGAPLGSTIASANLAPLNLPYLLLPDRMAPGIAKLLEMTVAIGGSFLLLRRWGLGRAGAALGGLAYVNTGFQIAWTNWPQSHVGALLPALLWGVERILQEGDRRSIGLTGVVLAAMVLEGFVPVLLFATILVGPYVGFRLLMAGRSGHPGRAAWQSVIGRFGALCVAGALGLALSAAQLLPFLQQSLGSVDLASREAGVVGQSLPETFLATALIPDALGSPVDGVDYGTINYVERLSFLGVTVCVLALVGILAPLRDERARAVRLSLVAAVALLTLAIYHGGAVLRALQMLPGFDINHIGRARSVLGFAVAMLAGFGFDHLGRLGREWSSARKRTAALLFGGASLAAGAVIWSAADAARAVGQLGYFVRQAQLPIVIAIGVVGTLVLLRRRPRSRGPVLCVLAVLVGVESLNAARPAFARISPDDLYPSTEVHRFLGERLGTDRVAAAELTLYPGTTVHYGIRTVTGHDFHQERWSELLEAAAPTAFARSKTFSFLPQSLEVATSPILDRMAARYWAADPELGILGRLTESRGTDGSLVITPGTPVTSTTAAAHLRGVVVTLTEPASVDGEHVRLAVALRDRSGRDVARGWRRIASTRRAGDLWVPLDADGGPIGQGPWTIELALQSDVSEDSLDLGAAGDDVHLGVVVADDELDVVLTTGAVLYERPNALPRIRWASEAQVEANHEQRLRLLSGGLDPSTVVLEDPSQSTASGGPGTVDLVADEGDVIRLRASSETGGWVVVADALQEGWRAQIDGQAVDLLRADHAMVAVRVPAGDHEIQLSADPPGFRAGARVSGVAVAGVALLILWPRRERRARRSGQA